MKKFIEYLEERDGAPPPLGDINGTGADLMRVLKLAVDDHRQDVMAMLAKLAKVDGRIRDGLEELKKLPPMRAPQETEKDVLVPHTADSAGGEEIE